MIFGMDPPLGKEYGNGKGLAGTDKRAATGDENMQGERAADQQRADKGEKDKMRGKRAFSQLFIDF